MPLEIIKSNIFVLWVYFLFGFLKFGIYKASSIWKSKLENYAFPVFQM